MEDKSAKGEPQQIVVFQQAGSGQSKIAGIQIFGTNIQFAKIFNIDQALPEFIDYPKEYISSFSMRNKKKALIRPIKPEDEPMEAEMFKTFSKKLRSQ